MLKIQIAYDNGDIVRLPAGGVLENDLVKLITDSILIGGTVHMGTKASLEKNIKTALYNFKSQIKQVPVGLHR